VSATQTVLPSGRCGEWIPRCWPSSTASPGAVADRAVGMSPPPGPLQLPSQTIELRDVGGRETFDHFGAGLQPRYRLVAADPDPRRMRCVNTSRRCGR